MPTREQTDTLINDALTQQGSSDRITGIEIREAHQHGLDYVDQQDAAVLAAAATDATNKANARQAALVSGTNIKTVNGASILGAGNITIAGGTDRLGTKVFYLSAEGILDDADVTIFSTTFGTDQTAAIQAILDQASATQPIQVHVDVSASVTGLDLNDNTTLILYSGCGFILRSNSNRPILQNADHSPTSITNRNIHICGHGVLNGNGYADSAGTTPNQLNGTALRGHSVGVAMYGVADCTMSGISLINIKTYATLWVWHEHSVIDNVKVYNGPTPHIYQDGLDFVGYCKDGKILNSHVSTGDDHILLAPTPGTGTADFDNFYASYYLGCDGPMDAVVDNITFGGESDIGIRLLSSVDRLDCRISNIKGSTKSYALISDNFFYTPSFPGTPGPGAFGNILIENFDVQVTGVVNPYMSNGWLNFGGNYENLTIRNITRRDHSGDPRATIVFHDDNMVVDNLTIDGYTAQDATSNTIQHIYLKNGQINHADISNAKLIRTGAASAASLFSVEAGATLHRINFNNALVDGANRVFANFGTTNYVSASNIRHINADTGEASFRTTSAIADIVLSNYYGFTPTSGTFTKERGDAYMVDGLPDAPAAPTDTPLTYAYTANVLQPYANGLTVGSAAVSGFGNYGVANEQLPAATDGRLITQMFTGEGGCHFKLTPSATPTDYLTMIGVGIAFDATTGEIVALDSGFGGVADPTGIFITSGDYICIFRNGTTGAMKIQTSPDKTVWADLPYTFVYNSTAALYNPIDVYKHPAAGVDGKLRNPSAIGFV